LSDTTAQNFGRARTFVARLGYVPALFSTCIRQIREAETSKDIPDEKRHSHAQNFAYNLIKISPSLRTALYSIASSYRKPDLDKIGPAPTTRALITLFQPSELAGIVATVFLFKRFCKWVEPGERDRLMPLLRQQTEIGWHVGATISNVGYGYGALIGIVRYAALGTFVAQDPKAFAKYRRELAPNKALFKPELEIATWGCSHLEIAALLMQNLGMGRGPGLGLSAGDNADHLIDEAHVGHHSLEEALCWRACVAWVESLHCFGKAPIGADNQDSELYLEQSSLDELGKIVTTIKENESAAAWLSTKSTDLPDEVRQSLKLIRSDSTNENEEIVDKETE
jgi:hypothetical protein